METHIVYFLLLALLIVALCAVVAWSRKERLYRWGAILCGVAIIGGSYPLMVNLLSRPRDVTEEWFNRNAKEALITGVYIQEGTALYLYLKLPGVGEPRSYRFPWSDNTRKLAQSVQEALDSEEGEGGVTLDSPFQPSEEREKPLTAHPKPQSKPPIKKAPRTPLEFGI